MSAIEADGVREGGAEFARAARRLSGAAMLLLHWAPHIFWSATPDELAAAFAWAAEARGDGGGTPPDAGTIAQLKERFPDG